MFTKDLRANVSLEYSQEEWDYCGPACAEMVRNGYPAASDRLFFEQDSLYNYIQTQNSQINTDISSQWHADPHGLTGCLNSLSNPANIHWTEFADSNSSNVLSSILHFINSQEFPSPVLVGGGRHWVVVVGFKTDSEPVPGINPSLQEISVYDPEPPDWAGVLHTRYSRDAWLKGVNAPWRSGVSIAGTWQNKYVAILEQASLNALVKVGRKKGSHKTKTGGKTLSPQKALEIDRTWTKDPTLLQESDFGSLPYPGLFKMDAWPVRQGVGPVVWERPPDYNIVPFGLQSELDRGGQRLARVCQVTKAKKGAEGAEEVEEVTTFGKPVRYLSSDEALGIVGAALQRTRNQLGNAKATLIYKPGEITQNRAFPFWQVNIDSRTIYVDQTGKLYGALLPRRPGN